MEIVCARFPSVRSAPRRSSLYLMQTTVSRLGEGRFNRSGKCWDRWIEAEFGYNRIVNRLTCSLLTFLRLFSLLELSARRDVCSSWSKGEVLQETIIFSARIRTEFHVVDVFTEE